MSHVFKNTVKTFPVLNQKQGYFYSIPALGKELGLDLSRLPVSIRIVLESVLRNCDGKKITEEHVRQLRTGNPKKNAVMKFLLSLPASSCKTLREFHCLSIWQP